MDSMKLEKAIYFPSIEIQFKDYMNKYVKGKILNAGSGVRAHPWGKDVVNIDIMKKEGVDVVADLHNIPVPDNTFDTVVNIAVLEHVKYPWVVVKEFYRVLKPGGILLCDAPFMQPRHLDPTDYYRYTHDGLKEIIKYGGFSIVESRPAHSYVHTWAWITYEGLKDKKIYNPIQYILAPIIRHLTKNRKVMRENCNSAHVVIATKGA